MSDLGQAPERGLASAPTRRGLSFRVQRAALSQRVDLWSGGWPGHFDHAVVRVQAHLEAGDGLELGVRLQG